MWSSTAPARGRRFCCRRFARRRRAWLCTGRVVAARARLEGMSSLRGQGLRIVLAGGSGQIGRWLAAYFQSRGDRVVVLTRAPYTAHWPTVYWNGRDEEPARGGEWLENHWTTALEGADVLINLSGHSIACPFLPRAKRLLRSSRMEPTELLGRVLARLERPPRLWMNASAALVGTQPPNRPPMGVRGELARIVDRWEAAFWAAQTPETRKIALRSALFLSPEPGNRFRLLAGLVRAGLGGSLGSGRQTVSWIHAEDFARAVDFLIEHEELSGAFNLAAPAPLPNRAFMAVLREALERPNGLPWPRPLLYVLSRLVRADAELALYSCYALPGQLERAGFGFVFPDWPSAAADLVRRCRARAE